MITLLVSGPGQLDQALASGEVEMGWGWNQTELKLLSNNTPATMMKDTQNLYRFLGIMVLLNAKYILQDGPLRWGWISRTLSSLATQTVRTAFHA